MLSNFEMYNIEKEQNRHGDVRSKAIKVLNKLTDSNDDIKFKISSGVGLSRSEVDIVFEAAKLSHPIPEDKADHIYWALTTPLVYRHFNQFGQEL